MAEAARVTRPGGTLVVDSPNRLLTPGLNWSHPEHTVGLTPAEMANLFALAGFDVTKTVGLWLCRDSRTGRMLAFDPNVPDADWSVTERLVAALESPTMRSSGGWKAGATRISLISLVCRRP